MSQQRFEITLEGTAQPVDYATQVEAEEAAVTVRQQHQGKAVEVREKATADEEHDANAQEERTHPVTHAARKSSRPPTV